MGIGAILIDAGGTLLAEHPSREALYATVAAIRGTEISPQEMRGCMLAAHRALPQEIGGNYRYTVPWFEAFIAHVFSRQLGLAESKLPELCAELFATFADAKNYRLTEGARELLDGARASGLKLCLISNWSPAMTTVLGGLGILGHFDVVLISALERVEKPDRAIFERALGRLNVLAREALHVGNEPVQDVRGASDCGIHTLLFDPANRHAALSLASIHRLAEVIPWIEKQR